MSTNELKKLAAQKSVEEVKSGMILGLGTGSTFKYALEAIADKIKSNELKDIKCVATSIKTEKSAKEYGLPLISLNQLAAGNSLEQLPVDLTIDGADEVTVGRPDPDLSGEGSAVINLIKGGGGALLREKIVAQNSKRNVIIIDETKLSDRLCKKSSLPVEVIPFAVETERRFLESFGAKVSLRNDEDGNEFITDEGNLILDADFNEIKNVEELDLILNSRAGIVEHGLFLNTASVVYCGTKEGLKLFKS